MALTKFRGHENGIYLGFTYENSSSQLMAHLHGSSSNSSYIIDATGSKCYKSSQFNQTTTPLLVASTPIIFLSHDATPHYLKLIKPVFWTGDSATRPAVST